MNRVMAVIAVLSVASLTANPVMAELVPSPSAQSVVISHIQAGATGDATREMVAVYNNGSKPVDITGWCVTNKSSIIDQVQHVISKPLGCFTGAESNERLMLPVNAYAVLASETFIAAHPESTSISFDAVFEKSVAITASSESLGLYDSDLVQLDAVIWSSSIEAGKVFVRKAVDSTQLIDTGAILDFEKVTGPVIPSSGVEYIRVVEDVCGNLEDIQEELPEGYGYDEAGNCELLDLDLCINIDAIQLSVPDGLMRADQDGCYVDVCPNIESLQRFVPIGHYLTEDVCLALESRILHLNEILANAKGSDAGQEFIELYNPNEVSISLTGYILLVGKSLENDYVLGSNNAVIPAGGYYVLRDDEIGFSLLNTSSKVQLRAPAGNLVSETEYLDPSDDQSWSWINGSWQYTNQLTPDTENIAMTESLEEVLGVSTTSTPCPAGKYRHPITNRCRNIESDTVMLVACDADEFRNPETNRCRKVASLASSLIPCNDGFERNSQTNRCRKTESTQKELAACQSGYERNPATNRCRKKVATASISSPASAVEATSSNSMLTTAVIVTTGFSALGYGIYEWRRELSQAIRRLVQMVSGN